MVTVRDMAERYGCSLKTARRYLRQMFHYEEPLAAPMWAFEEWEHSRETMPDGVIQKRMVDVRGEQGRTIVPRKRG